MACRILPLCTVEEVRAELEDTNRSLLRLIEFSQGLDRDRYDERRRTLLRWKARLEQQLDDMEAAGV